MHVINKISLIALSVMLSVSFSYGQNENNFKDLSEEAKISLLFMSPDDTNMMSIFGHTGLRVSDPELGIDFVFNYGAPNPNPAIATYQLIRGTLKSIIWGTDYSVHLQTTKDEKRAMNEHVLNLSPEEKQILFEKLLDGAKYPKDHYLFDILRKNCTTFLFSMVEESLSGEILLPDNVFPEEQTFREVGNEYAYKHTWFLFFTDLILGTPVDRKVSLEETLYIPERLETVLLSAVIKEKNGDTRPVFTSSSVILKSDKIIRKDAFSPFITSLLLLILTILFTIIEYIKKRNFRWIDYILFGIAGIAGICFVFIVFGSGYWYFLPNWNILWLHPLHFLGMIPVSSKKTGKIAYLYHIVNVCLIGIMLLGIFFIPQHYNIAFIFLMLCLLIRSFANILRFNKP